MEEKHDYKVIVKRTITVTAEMHARSQNPERAGELVLGWLNSKCLGAFYWYSGTGLYVWDVEEAKDVIHCVEKRPLYAEEV